MIAIVGGDLVLPRRVIASGALIIEGERIVALDQGRGVPAGTPIVDAGGCYVVPGFVDIHMHGLHGHDTHDPGDAIVQMASLLPQYGVTAFCPTTIACPPDALRAVLQQVRVARATQEPTSARVLPAHLESNFINEAYRGAQPADCIRSLGVGPPRPDGVFSSSEILDALAAYRPEIGIVTLAPELPGALDLIRVLVAAGHRVSLGHSGADFATAMAAIDAGATQATHLFNRMTPLHHREPGLPGAVLARDEVAVELICDGHHVHPAICRLVMNARGPQGVMAVTDATAGAGLAVGSTSRLGGHTIHVGEAAAVLEDGTLAGSTLTMDQAFRNMVTYGRTVMDAARMCSTTPARHLGLTGFGSLAEGHVADVALLDRALRTVRTFIAGREVWRRPQMRPAFSSVAR